MHRDSKRTGAPQDRFVRDSDPFHKIFPVRFAKRCPVPCSIEHPPIHPQPSGSKTPTEEIRLNRGAVLLDDEENKADTGGVPSRRGEQTCYEPMQKSFAWENEMSWFLLFWRQGDVWSLSLHSDETTTCCCLFDCSRWVLVQFKHGSTSRIMFALNAASEHSGVSEDVFFR